MSLGEKIRKLRLSKDITQKELADKLNVSFQTVSKWENNINEPDLTSLKKLTYIFNCPIDFFFEDDEIKINNSLENIVKENKKVEESKNEDQKNEGIDNNTTLKNDENSNSEDSEIKEDQVDDSLNKNDIIEIKDNPNKDASNIVSIKESNKVSLIKKIDDGNSPSIIRKCSYCLSPIVNNCDYYEVTKIDINRNIKKEYYCKNCYYKMRNESSNKIGSCKDCGCNLYKNDEYFRVKRLNSNNEIKEVLLCEDCYKSYLRAKSIDNSINNTYSNSSRAKSKSSYGNSKQKKTYSSISLRNDSTIIKWSLILGAIALISTLGVCIYNYKEVGLTSTILLPILFGYMVLSTIYCLFSDTYISDVFGSIAGKMIRFPGLIFEFSLDGIAWLIGMKILFAIIGFLVGLGSILLATFVAIFLSFFSYIPLLSYNKVHYRNFKD